LSISQSVKNQLLLRRQFILGPHFVEDVPGWKKIKHDDSLFLTVHPELEITQASSGGSSITMLGFILDPFNPQATNMDICSKLINQVDPGDDVFQRVEHMGGRYVIVLSAHNDTKIFNDAMGQKTIYYTRDSSGLIWCASQWGSLSEQLRLEFGKDTWNEFLESRFFNKDPQYWYPGDSSPFKAIYHLQPNHYLDLKTSEVVRYWPKANLDFGPIDRCVEQSAEILRGLMKAASHRFNLALALSAGYDSRLILAASREVSKDIVFFSQIYPGMDEKSMDIRISDKLLLKLGLDHRIVRCPSKIDDPDFLEIYKKNIPTARLIRALGIYCSYKLWGETDTVVMVGLGGELYRCKYGDRRKYSGNKSRVNAKTLARFTWMRGNDFAIRQYEKWLSTTEQIWKDYGINTLDLFHWEQRKANWGSLGIMESDIAHETFLPNNCRRHLAILLSTHEKYRMPPNYELNRRLLSYLWPETLDVPINPYPFKVRTKMRARRLMRRLGIIG